MNDTSQRQNWSTLRVCCAIVAHQSMSDEVEPAAQQGDDDQRLHREAADLLRQVGEGDRDAFGELYDRFSGALLALALTVLADRAEAEDVLQEVFLIVWGRAKLYDPALGKAVSWLMTVTRNKCLDRLRSAKRKRDAMESARDELAARSREETPAADANETRDLLGRALFQLPEKQRQAIELAFLKGYTQMEVAELLGEPIGTIKARIRRGMLQMRGLLDQREESGEANGGEENPS